jgi:hypothetical protein
MAEECPEIKLDKRNYRKHNDENKRLIKKSLEECGTGRSIVIDNDNEVICGNGVFESAKELGIPVKVIETTGNEVIAIKRTDLNRDDEKRDKLAILDNSTTDLSEFDYDLLKEDFAEDYLNSLGIDLPELEIQSETEQKDISDDLKEGYEVVCECETEQEQEQLFYKLTEEGIKCRLLTL